MFQNIWLRENFKKVFFIRIWNYPKLRNPAFIKKLNLLLYYVCRSIKFTKDEYDILCLSLFRSYRFAAYKQFSSWIYNQLSKGFRKIITSCALWSIREKYPLADGSYFPFKESRDDEARQLYRDNWCTSRGTNFIDHLDMGANQEGLPKLRRWHKMNPFPWRHTASFQRLFDVAQASKKHWNDIVCLQG